MILPFSQKFKDGTPNYFAEKIISSLDLSRSEKFTVFEFLIGHLNPSQDDFLKGACNPLWKFNPKIHSFREDKNDRWKAGVKVHAVLNCRTNKMFTFAETICKSVQTIQIIPSNLSQRLPTIVVDDRTLSKAEIWELLKNDGFGSDDGLDHFNAWFQKEFYGKIIHWTDLRY